LKCSDKHYDFAPNFDKELQTSDRVLNILILPLYLKMGFFNPKFCTSGDNFFDSTIFGQISGS